MGKNDVKMLPVAARSSAGSERASLTIYSELDWRFRASVFVDSVCSKTCQL